MLISLIQLKKLPVYTESGVLLGKIYNINFNIESQSVFDYEVKLSYFGRQIFTIKPAQIKIISHEKIVVEDAILKISQSTAVDNNISSHELNTVVTINSSHS